MRLKTPLRIRAVETAGAKKQISTAGRSKVELLSCLTAANYAVRRPLGLRKLRRSRPATNPA